MKTGQFEALSEQSKEQRIKQAARVYGQFLSALGFEWEDDAHMKDTPMRVAKAWVNDLASGCFNEPPSVTSFANDGYDGMILQKNIQVSSMCAHHNLPFFGKCNIAYLPKGTGRVIGLSKLNRIAKYFAQRPSVQELLTEQIHEFVNEHTDNKGVAVVITAQHCCVLCRGTRDDSEMTTSKLSGYFFDNTVGTRTEFFSLLKP